MIFGQKTGQNLYRSIDLPKFWWRHCDVAFDCIVVKFFSVIYLDTIFHESKFR